MASKDYEIVWTPQKKQIEFLACPDYEVCYGGAAGGGKSDALLIDILGLQHNAISNKNHRAIIFRRSFPELTDLIDRSHELYPASIPGIKYNKNDHFWSAPSGAKIYFGYLAHDNDRFKHRGKAYNVIDFDELTLWPTPVCYEYLISRNRTIDPSLPRYVRSATNPDGPGQKWVMERFGIKPDGKASMRKLEIMREVKDGKGGYIEVPETIIRRFIPAKLTDNEYLRGTGYRESLMNLPPDEREALLDGLWSGNRVKGAFYVNEMQRARAENRIGKVPFVAGIPVNTFWDIGFNDCTAIWFHQQVGLQHRFIYAYHNSGEWFSHYATHLLKLSQERGYVYGTHYLPHDGANNTVQTGKRNIDILGELMPNHKFDIIPRTPHVYTGIQLTRAAMTQCWIDEEGCGDGIAALDCYRKKWSEPLQAFTDSAVHDSFSDYADAFRQWGQWIDTRPNTSADPAWIKKLIAMKRNARRSAMTS